MMKQIIIGVMGAGESATQIDQDNGYQLGKQIAQQGWILLTGGRNIGVMDAASRGAKAGGGLTIGILPGSNAAAASPAVDIAIVTGMGSARNNINVLSSHVVVACGVGLGTVSEIALALKADKPVICLNEHPQMHYFFSTFSRKNLFQATDILTAVSLIKTIINED
jgi:uncharacterized protein (TIGR00725 family)